MRPSLSIALLLLGAALTPCAWGEATTTPVAQLPSDAEAIAIEKTLVLATLLQAEEHEEGSTLNSSEQNMQRCLSFAQTQGAPAPFIELLKASAQDTNLEESTKLAEQIDALLSLYKIDLMRLHVWTSICLMDANTAEKWLHGTEGSQALKGELAATDAAFITALSDEDFQRSASAMKKALLLLAFYNIKDNLRITDEHLAQVISFAEAQGAPKVFERLLKADSSRTIAPNMRYEVNNFLDKLLEAYLIDRKSLRFYAEGCGISPDEMIELITSQSADTPFFVHFSFNLLPLINAQVTPEEAEALSDQWLQDVRHIAEKLAAITPENEEDADLQDIAKRIPSYMRAQSIQWKRDAAFAKMIASTNPDRIRHLAVALKVTQGQLARLLQYKEELPVALRALLAQFI